MPFTIPEIYVGQVVSGEAVLTNGQIDTQINPAPLAQTPTYNPLLQPQQRRAPTSFKEVCQNDMHNGVLVKECFLMPVYEE
jgi:hypothetical protein